MTAIRGVFLSLLEVMGDFNVANTKISFLWGFYLIFSLVPSTKWGVLVGFTS